MGGTVSTNEPTLPTTDVLLALDSLVEHPGLRLSERNRRFLDFVVRETIGGHGERIKAYTIGVDVFGRDTSFDPSVDPIVRIEANRVRSALAKYYESAGCCDPIRISIPAGTYVPTFAAAPPLKATVSSTSLQPSVAMSMAVRERSGPGDAETAIRRDLFANAVMRGLARIGYKVFWSPPDADPAAAKAIGERLGRCLDIAVHDLGCKRRYSWRFWETDSGAVLLCDHRDLEIRTEPCVALIDETAEILVHDLSFVAIDS